jgi:hypothetical protein
LDRPRIRVSGEAEAVGELLGSGVAVLCIPRHLPDDVRVFSVQFDHHEGVISSFRRLLIFRIHAEN